MSQSISAAAKPFLSTVINTFDFYNPPAADPNQDMLFVPNADPLKINSEKALSKAEQEGFLPAEQMLANLPKELRTIVYDQSPNMAHWLNVTEILFPNGQTPDTLAAINQSAKNRLKLLGQELRWFPISAKDQLLSFIFVDAFSKATVQQKEEIIFKMRSIGRIKDAAQSGAERIAITVGKVFYSVFQNPAFQLVAGVFLAYQAAVIFLAVKPIISTYLSGHVIPSLVTTFINRAPLVVVHAANLVIGCVTWVVNKQFMIMILRWTIGGQNPFVDRVLNILYIPSKIGGAILMMPLTLAIKAFSLSYTANVVIGASLHQITDAKQRARLTREGTLAYNTWMQLARDGALLPAPPAPVVAVI